MRTIKEYSIHPGAIKSRTWRAAHPKSKTEECKRYRLKHPDRVKISRRKWKSQHREQCRVEYKQYYLNNKAVRYAYWAKRRARCRSVTKGSTTAIVAIYKRAKYFKQWFDVAVDHIIPLSRGGIHSADNLQIIYAYENARKGSRLDYKPRVIFR